MQFNIPAEFKNASGVYIIRNSVNSKVYVGSAIHFRKRFRGHRLQLRANKHHSQRLQNHFNKYGEESLTFCLLEVTSKDRAILLETEQRYLNNFSSFRREKGFNNVQQVFPAIQHSNETKAKMAAANKKRPPISNETREKLRQAAKGRPLSEAQLRAVRDPSNIVKRTAAAVAKGAWNKGAGHLSKCLRCEVEFRSRPSSKRRYCSLKCSREAPLSQETRKKLAESCSHLHMPDVLAKIAATKSDSKRRYYSACQTCGNRFEWAHRGQNRKYCSNECASKKTVTQSTRDKLSQASKAARLLSPPPTKFSSAQIGYLRDNYSKLPVVHFAEMWGVSMQQVYNIASRSGIKRRTRCS